MRGLVIVMVAACSDPDSPPPAPPPPPKIIDAGAPDAPKRPPPRRPDPLAFDAAACRPGDGGARSLALGSQSIEVVGPDGDTCVFIHRTDVEGGYQSERCRVARTLGVIKIPSAHTPSPVPGACVVEKTGNVFLDEQKR